MLGIRCDSDDDDSRTTGRRTVAANASGSSQSIGIGNKEPFQWTTKHLEVENAELKATVRRLHGELKERSDEIRFLKDSWDMLHSNDVSKDAFDMLQTSSAEVERQLRDRLQELEKEVLEWKMQALAPKEVQLHFGSNEPESRDISPLLTAHVFQSTHNEMKSGKMVRHAACQHSPVAAVNAKGVQCSSSMNTVALQTSDSLSDGNRNPATSQSSIGIQVHSVACDSGIQTSVPPSAALRGPGRRHVAVQCMPMVTGLSRILQCVDSSTQTTPSRLSTQCIGTETTCDKFSRGGGLTAPRDHRRSEKKRRHKEQPTSRLLHQSLEYLSERLKRASAPGNAMFSIPVPRLQLIRHEHAPLVTVCETNEACAATLTQCTNGNSDAEVKPSWVDDILLAFHAVQTTAESRNPEILQYDEAEPRSSPPNPTKLFRDRATSPLLHVEPHRVCTGQCSEYIAMRERYDVFERLWHRAQRAFKKSLIATQTENHELRSKLEVTCVQ